MMRTLGYGKEENVMAVLDSEFLQDIIRRNAVIAGYAFGSRRTDQNVPLRAMVDDSRIGESRGCKTGRFHLQHWHQMESDLEEQLCVVMERKKAMGKRMQETEEMEALRRDLESMVLD